MTERKEYLIQLFIKRCTLQSTNNAHILFSFKLFSNTYNIPSEKLVELEKRYTLEKYIERIVPLIDKQFTEEELQEAIKFYSSPIGRKLIDRNFLTKIGKVGTKMFAEIEQEFALSNQE